MLVVETEELVAELVGEMVLVMDKEIEIAQTDQKREADKL